MGNFRRTKKGLKRMNCFPSKSNKTKRNLTCYTDESLIKMRDLWNERHKDNKITSDIGTDIWKHFKNNLINICDNEMCWLRQNFLNNNLKTELFNYTFAPVHPESWNKNKNEWLSSDDIGNVMKQYEISYPYFTFFGPAPIDFAKKSGSSCIWPEICNFDLSTYMKKGKSKFGFIFNTDTHDKSGAHWISMFLDIHKKFLFFFDSNGTPASNEIKDLADKLIDQCKKQNIDITFETNKNKEHQKTNTECGMYSLYFIIQMITETFHPTLLKNKIITDNQMEKLRKIYFNEEKK